MMVSESTEKGDSSTTQVHDLDALISNGIQLLEDGDLPSALQFATRSLEQWGKNPKTLELLAHIQLESGNWQGATDIFKEIIELAKPNGWAPAHMSLGQMTTGKDSAAHYQEGIRLFLEKVNDPNLTPAEVFDLQRKNFKRICCSDRIISNRFMF
ncbi:hypothetical protein DSO57_1022029 [Entomophthora muscae]|uniref:Uncharacterized protein n=1 Tax=Entomophthora muscae TaxID=34485 RepID=A0ACC2UCP2_9FUNG|nr:hypothetical protein DSO57_1022029 [Entomophthora muscae]